VKESKVFEKAGITFGSLNGVYGFVKLYPLGSVVIRARPRLGWEAMSPRKSRVRAGVMVSLGIHSGRGLKAFLASLECFARVPDSWVWKDGGTGTLNSAHGARVVKRLHWKGGPHAQ